MNLRITLKSAFSVVMIMLLLYGCRHDYLEGRQDISKSTARLSSKVVSLEDSPQKDKILPYLENAESIMAKSKKRDIYGKVVSFGDGVTIDTDHVVYIENGANYHTYTFNIQRDNPLPGAPIENLILSPLPDGSYMELLATYTVTEQEKKIIMQGNGFDSRGKVKMVRLEKGTFNNNNQLTGRTVQSCGWVEETIWTPCSSGDHLGGDDYWSCEYVNNLRDGHPPLAYTVVTYKCVSIDDGSGNDWGTSGGGGSDTGTGGAPGGTGITNTCSGTGVLATPQDPSNGLNPGCNDGVPTLPNIGSPNTQTPCEKAKTPTQNFNNVIKNTSVSPNLDLMKYFAKNANDEYALTVVSNNGNYTANPPFTTNQPGEVTVPAPTNGDYVSCAHTHNDGGAAPPSAADLYVSIQNAIDFSSYQGSLVFSDNGAVYSFIITDRQAAAAFLAAYPEADNLTSNRQLFNKNTQVGKDFNIIYEDFTQGRAPNYSGNNQNDGLETALAHILEKYNAGMVLAKADSNGNFKPMRATSFDYEIPASGGKHITAYKTETCP